MDSLASAMVSRAHPASREQDQFQFPYVGRDRELQTLRDAFNRAADGAGQVVLITGEPGVGKTHSAEILCLEARESGALTLWGTSFDWKGGPAYWPWTQVLRECVRQAKPDPLSELSSDQARLVAHFVPEISAPEQQSAGVAPGRSTAHFYRMLGAIGALLRTASERQVLVVVLDDVHWSDTASLQVLRFLAQEIRDARILLIATYRETEIVRDHPASSILPDLHRAPHCRRVPLKPLSRPLVELFVSIVTGEKQQSSSLIDTLYDETGGNPFFMTEVVRSMIEDTPAGEALDYARRPGVPESVRNAVGERITRLSPECAELLTASSVIGREVDLYLLERASGVSLPSLLDILDEPARLQLITRDDDAPASFRFRHSLVREALYQEMASARRAQLHLAVAEALERADRLEPRWFELAHHFNSALPLSDPARVLHYAERAGHAAMRQFAWSEAEAQFQRALSMLEYAGSSNPAHRCDLLLALGEAQNRSGPGSGDVSDARASFLEAFRIAEEFGDGDRMARSAIGYAGMNIVAAFGGSRQITMVEQALDALETVDCPLRVRVQPRLAVDLWHRSPENLSRSRELSDNAVAMANRLGDDTLIGYALWSRHTSGFQPDNLEERIADSRRLALLAEKTGDPTIATWGCLAQVCDALEMGDHSSAEEAMAWLRQFDQRVSSPFVAYRVSAFSAAINLMKGEYADAAREIERADQLWQSDEPHQHQIQSFILSRDIGQLSAMTCEIRLPDHRHPWREAARAHRMALALERGSMAEARADYDAFAEANLTDVLFTRHWYVTVVMLAEAAVAFQDERRAATLLELMKPYADRLAFDGPLFIGHGPVSLYLGRLAAALQEWDTALDYLDHALERCRQLGLRPYSARSMLAQAEILVARDRTGDRPAADRLTDQALSLASEIGMYGLSERAIVFRDSIPSPLENTLGLTRRELEVLRLVGQGLTDGDVAERLFLSPRTVSTHLTSIYTKLNVSSRTAATRIASEHGLD